jgi:hypothetical protein
MVEGWAEMMMKRFFAFAVAFGFLCAQAQAAFVGAPAQFAVLIGGSTDQIVTVAPGTAGIPLTSQGASSNPSFAVCTVVGGCTGLATITAHTLLIGNGTSNPNLTTATAGSVLAETTTSADPAFTVTPTLGVASTTAGTLTLANSTTAFSPTIQAPGVTPASYNFNLPLTAGSSGQFLTSGGGGSTNMTWSTGGIALTVATATGNSPITITATNELTTIISMATPAASTINLPTAVQTAGWRECVKDGTTNFATNNATVKSPTSGTIDGVTGSTGIVMNQAHQELCFISDGTNWFVE